jgi:molybdopterin converting factor small subunit
VRQVVAGLSSSSEPRVAAIGPDGDLNRFVNACLNDTDVRHLEDLDTPVGEGDTLVLLPAMAGG